MRIPAFLLILLFLVPSLQFLNSQEAEAVHQPYPIVIELDQSKHIAYPNGEVDFQLNITGRIYRVFKDDHNNYSATIKAESDDFEVSGPLQFEFINGSTDEYQFSFSVKVPKNASSRGKYGIHFSGRCTFNVDYGFIIPPDTAMIVCKVFYNETLECMDSVKFRAGNSRTVDLNVTNLGNGNALYRFHLRDEEKWERRGWNLSFSSPGISVNESSHQIEKLRIEVPEDEKPGIYDIEIAISPAGAPYFWGDPHGTISVIRVKVLNNYKDEVVAGLMIGGPIALIILVVISIVLIIRRKRR